MSSRKRKLSGNRPHSSDLNVTVGYSQTNREGSLTTNRGCNGGSSSSSSSSSNSRVVAPAERAVWPGAVAPRQHNRCPDHPNPRQDCLRCVEMTNKRDAAVAAIQPQVEPEHAKHFRQAMMRQSVVVGSEVGRSVSLPPQRHSMQRPPGPEEVALTTSALHLTSEEDCETTPWRQQWDVPSCPPHSTGAACSTVVGSQGGRWHHEHKDSSVFEDETQAQGWQLLNVKGELDMALVRTVLQELQTDNKEHCCQCVAWIGHMFEYNSAPRDKTLAVEIRDGLADAAKRFLEDQDALRQVLRSLARVAGPKFPLQPLFETAGAVTDSGEMFAQPLLALHTICTNQDFAEASAQQGLRNPCRSPKMALSQLPHLCLALMASLITLPSLAQLGTVSKAGHQITRSPLTVRRLILPAEHLLRIMRYVYSDDIAHLGNSNREWAYLLRPVLDQRQQGMQWVFNFGSHKGFSLSDVLKQSPRYIPWCLRWQVDMTPARRRFRKALVDAGLLPLVDRGLPTPWAPAFARRRPGILRVSACVSDMSFGYTQPLPLK
jgi:hypothetical protein